MDEKELKEILSAIEKAGWRPELCDTPVPVSYQAVKCGIPTDMGDECIDDYILLPKAVVGTHPYVLVPVSGDSMIDAGYENGDKLRVQLGVDAYDGDDVFVWVDGGCTVKTLFTDEDGNRWLVPRNDTYDAIPLTEDMDVRVFGVVRSVEKVSPRNSSRELLKSIRRTKEKQKQAKRMSAEMVDRQMVAVSGIVVHARQWYAVYRALLDKNLVQAGDYQGFCAHVRELVPEHKHLPEAKEISRMAVQSFSKPVTMWTENDAPVRGNRFRDYLNIALEMGNLLSNPKK